MPMSMSKWSHMGAAARQSGVGMIEVLVAVLVMSIGVLGYAGLQLRALNSTGESHFQTQAAAIAQDVVERITANNDMRDFYGSADVWPQGDNTNAPPGDWAQCYEAACNQGEMAQWDVNQVAWLAWNLLPNGRVVVDNTCTAAGDVFCITVAWGESVPADCDPTSDSCLVLEVLP